MEIELVSKCCIKPTSSTPPHLKTYKFSLLDQFMPPIFFSTALFYPNTIPSTSHTRSQVLKNSLSKTLKHFYPLAGKIKDSYSIDCNDEGVNYIEATTKITLSEFLVKPDLSLLPKLVPDVASSFIEIPIGEFVMMIQETTFACGGLAIGLKVSHMALDATALASFIKHWALAASSKGNQITNSNLDSPFVFPLFEDFPKGEYITSICLPLLRKEKISVRRLVFNELAINKLKAKASSISVENPSRVEVVSAIISKSIKAALNANFIAIMHAINMRKRAKTPFADSSFGNFVWLVPAISTENETEISSLVYKMRNTIRKIDGGFMEDVRERGFSKLYEELKETRSVLSGEGMEAINFSSWCNLGLYDIDFGWGKPTWISHCDALSWDEVPFVNFINLDDTRSGNGIEAWLYVFQDVSTYLERDNELLEYASIDPSPLHN